MRRTAERVACALGADRVARRANAERLLILCYHGVVADGGRRHWLLMPRSEFRRQIAHVARHYRCLPLDEAIAGLRHGALREPTACVTFDDGYLNNRTEALPLLQEFGVPATIFLTTALVGTSARLWTTRLELAFEHASAPSVDLRSLGLAVATLGDTASRRAAAKSACEALKLLPSAQRAERVATIEAALGTAAVDARAADDGAFELMSWSDVRAMEETGLITFGAHTAHHEIVSRLDDAGVEAEVAGSMRVVREHTARPSGVFCYPNGRPQDFDARAAAAIRAAGGVAAVTTVEALNGADADPFALARVTLGGDVSFDNFRLRVAGLNRGAVAPRPRVAA